MKRRMLGLTSGVALTILLTAPAATQAIAYRELPAPRAAAPLADAYHLSLQSAWPQLGTSGIACRNGGDEMVRGMVTRNAAGIYEGTLDRSTLLFFCGTHSVSGESCQLVLEGDGSVAVRGGVVPDEASPSGSALRLSWTPRADHAAEVQGACSADFKHSVREMYLTVRHGAEFALPVAGKGIRERLEDYAWTVEVE
ncbi:MAG TPA: hypothetical protein VM094_07340 [Gemmatimonadales bacterium]|nr:hypothetical protein [Gemmatimonadales bacterium]